jgi:hypothetical protein
MPETPETLMRQRLPEVADYLEARLTGKAPFDGEEIDLDAS